MWALRGIPTLVEKLKFRCTYVPAEEKLLDIPSKMGSAWPTGQTQKWNIEYSKSSSAIHAFNPWVCTKPFGQTQPPTF